MSELFSPIQLGPIALTNRVMVAPMCQYSAVNGNATDWHVMHLGNMAMSGAALLVLEASAVQDVGRITHGCLGLWCDDNEAALARVLKVVRGVSPIKIFIQLAHAGRKAASARPWEGGQQLPEAADAWPTYAPSPIAHNAHEIPPIEIDAPGLQQIKQAFVASALRAKRLGLDGVELHAAHGYLLHEFLSPIANQRSDQYGGSLENRMRFVLEVFEDVFAAVGQDMAVGVRISATDWVENGWSLEDSITLAKALEARGCHYIDVSSGGVSSAQKIELKAGYQVPHARAIKKACAMPTIAVGLITDPEHAEQIIKEGDADMVALARGLLYDPRWAWHAAAKLGATVNAPPQYWRCQPAGLRALFENATTGAR